MVLRSSHERAPGHYRRSRQHRGCCVLGSYGERCGHVLASRHARAVVHHMLRGRGEYRPRLVGNEWLPPRGRGHEADRSRTRDLLLIRSSLCASLSHSLSEHGLCFPRALLTMLLMGTYLLCFPRAVLTMLRIGTCSLCLSWAPTYYVSHWQCLLCFSWARTYYVSHGQCLLCFA